jgi:hypothetical protein
MKSVKENRGGAEAQRFIILLRRRRGKKTIECFSLRLCASAMKMF